MTRVGIHLLLRAIVLTGCQRHEPPDSPVSQVAHTQVERGPVKVTVDVKPSPVRLSDEPTLTLTIEYETGVEIQKPPFGESVGDFLIRDFQEPLTEFQGGREIVRQIYKLEPIATGLSHIDPIVVHFTDKRSGGDGKSHQIETDPLAIQVLSMVQVAPSLENLRGYDGPRELAVRRPIWLWWVGGLAVLAVTGSLLWFRRRKQPPSVEKTPRELAEMELDALHLPEANDEDLKRYYVALTGIVRRYIERTTGIQAPEQTTEEFLREIGRSQAFSRDERQRLKDFLESADLVKFAAHRPLPEDVDESLRVLCLRGNGSAGGGGVNSFRFADPLWLLLAGPVLVAILASIRRERRGTMMYSSTKLVAGLPITLAQRVKRFLPWMQCLGMLLVVVAIARPQAGLSEHRVRAEGIAIVVCLDRSGSMEAMDFDWQGKRVNRLVAVKNVLRDFIAGNGHLSGRKDDLIGLIAFGGFAETKVPLTLDHGLVLQVLDSVQIPQPVYDSQGDIVNQRYFEEERATAIGDAVTLAVDRLKASTAKSKVLLLLSDGENTAGVVQPFEASATAKHFGIKIHSIGVGTTGRAPFPATDRFGRPVFVAQEVRLDEATLKKMATETGGAYFHAQNTKALQSVYDDIDAMEKSVSEGTTYTEYRELFQWWLLPGIALVIANVTLRLTRFRTLP